MAHLLIIFFTLILQSVATATSCDPRTLVKEVKMLLDEELAHSFARLEGLEPYKMKLPGSKIGTTVYGVPVERANKSLALFTFDSSGEKRFLGVFKPKSGENPTQLAEANLLPGAFINRDALNSRIAHELGMEHIADVQYASIEEFGEGVLSKNVPGVDLEKLSPAARAHLANDPIANNILDEGEFLADLNLNADTKNRAKDVHDFIPGSYRNYRMQIEAEGSEAQRAVGGASIDGGNMLAYAQMPKLKPLVEGGRSLDFQTAVSGLARKASEGRPISFMVDPKNAKKLQALQNHPPDYWRGIFKEYKMGDKEIELWLQSRDRVLKTWEITQDIGQRVADPTKKLSIYSPRYSQSMKALDGFPSDSLRKILDDYGMPESEITKWVETREKMLEEWRVFRRNQLKGPIPAIPLQKPLIKKAH